MGLYRGWRGEALFPWLLWIRVCLRIMPLCVSVEFICLSISLSVCLSKSLYMPVCLHVSLSPSLSPSLSLSICGVGPADQDPELDTGKFKSLVGTLNQSRTRLTLAGRSPFS